MLTATLWCLATGLLWTLVGIYFTALNRRGCDALGLNLASAVFLVLISLSMVPWPEVLAERAPEARLADLSIAMLLAGGTMAAGLVLMMAAMRRGPADVAWSICQSSMVIPFSLGALINQSPVHALNVAGLGAVAAGIGLFGRRKTAPKPDPTSRGGYAAAILAFLVIGLGQ
jgi:drug/metabolite transporter (DMT)-like permease